MNQEMAETNEPSVGCKAAKGSFQFGKCRICSDDATGIHYGVTSCEGCKVNKSQKLKFFLFNLNFVNF